MFISGEEIDRLAEERHSNPSDKSDLLTGFYISYFYLAKNGDFVNGVYARILSANKIADDDGPFLVTLGIETFVPDTFVIVRDLEVLYIKTVNAQGEPGEALCKATSIDRITELLNSDDNVERPHLRLVKNVESSLTFENKLAGVKLILIAAMDKEHGIGKDNKLPWRLPDDMALFKQLTTGHTVIMGRKTFDSVGKALPNRTNIVITRNRDWTANGVTVAHSILDALEHIDSNETTVYFIGGEQIYKEAIMFADRLLITEIEKTYDCDTFFPEIHKSIWKETSRTTLSDLGFAFVTYEPLQSSTT